MATKKQFTEDQKQLISDMMSNNHPIYIMAKKLQVDPIRLKQYCTMLGYVYKKSPLPNKVKNTERDKEIIEMFNNLFVYTYEEIGQKFGITRERVRQIATSHDVYGSGRERQRIRTIINQLRNDLQKDVEKALYASENKPNKKAWLRKAEISTDLLVEEYFENKLSSKQIHAKYGITPRAVLLRLQKAGYKTRTRTESQIVQHANRHKDN